MVIFCLSIGAEDFALDWDFLIYDYSSGSSIRFSYWVSFLVWRDAYGYFEPGWATWQPFEIGPITLFFGSKVSFSTLTTTPWIELFRI